MRLLLDTGILGQLCHPNTPKNKQTAEWLDEVMKYPEEAEIIIPEICDYELRRKLIHLIRKNQALPASLERLNNLGQVYRYLPLDTETMQRSAELWADARSRGLPTATDSSLDGDVILAAQASGVSGAVVTNNRKHLSIFVEANDWRFMRVRVSFTCLSGVAGEILIDDPGCFVIKDATGKDWFCIRKDYSISELEAGTISMKFDLEPINDFHARIKKLGFETEGTTTAKLASIDFPIQISDDCAIRKLRQSWGDGSGFATIENVL